MVILFIAALYLSFVIFITRIFMPREQGLGTVFIFGMSAFIYNLAIPVESVLTLHFWGHPYMFREEWMVQAAAMGLLALIGFSLGLYMSGFRLKLENWNCPLEKDTGRPGAKGNIGIWLLFIIAIAIIGTYFRPLLPELSSYYGNYTTLNLNPIFAYFLKISVLCAGIISAYNLFLGRRALISIIGIGAIILWGIYSSNKDPILVGLVSCSAYSYRMQISSRISSVVVGVLLVIALAGIGPLIFSLYRAGVEISLFAAFSRGVFLRSDPIGPFSTLISTFDSDPPIQVGISYLQSTISWIPRFMWPLKPLSMSQAYAQMYIPDWQSGRGIGFSLLAESYINFRQVGPLIQYSLIGFAWGMGWRLMRKYKSIDDTIYKSIYVVVGFYILIIMHRGDTTLIVTQVVQSIIPIVLMVVVSGKLRWRKS